jgi:hypothetical protein
VITVVFDPGRGRQLDKKGESQRQKAEIINAFGVISLCMRKSAINIAA